VPLEPPAAALGAVAGVAGGASPKSVLRNAVSSSSSVRIPWEALKPVHSFKTPEAQASL
jgi:hypothetical protein